MHPAFASRITPFTRPGYWSLFTLTKSRFQTPTYRQLTIRELLAIGKSELDPYEGKLPTTKIIQPAFELMVKPEYVNTMTGEPVPDHDPTAILGSGVFGHSLVGMRETPDRTTFMALAHVLLAMICGSVGSVGAKFAVWIDPKQSQVPPRGK